MKKIFISLVSLLVFTSCVLHVYSFTSTNYNNDKISIKANLVDEQKENSPLNYIYIYDKRSNATEHHKIKILSPTIKIVSDGKEYVITPNSETIKVYKQGVVITDDFKAYIGKVQLDDGTIIDIPPLSFKKNVYVESYNPVTDTINAGARTKRLFSGTVEDYKKQKK
ncbi:MULTISPECIES: hypothetical protein [Fusobacterium]|uniref:LPS export ABC transporter periplasmic protein LptC n=3 Tax=Fusobacterium TaxID=848 RepID=A0AAD0HU05_9FUSO|nr:MULTISPECIES: hypothetical protein [Fusobacterium]ATV70102.1 hypothetical protein CTM98_05245 [Fusobacterium pseudoperiodonticum]AVQ24412.1 hypothetical protein C4N17_01070 [Fusobacterium periodonticum]KGE62759.1 hypothetical protein FSAG_002278 [Fusobacterium periodonticum 2_1_31]MDU2235721.1 hypothetical protein [Fusobacterium periodonticum]PIM77274.1 hypothetical protein CTM69_10705 [Fusobacterium pseudoperiodonticum]